MTFGNPEWGCCLVPPCRCCILLSDGKSPRPGRERPGQAGGFRISCLPISRRVLWKGVGTPSGSSSFLSTPHSGLGILPFDKVFSILWDINFKLGWDYLSIMGSYSRCDKNVFCLWQIFEPSQGTWSLLGACFCSGLKLAKSQSCLFLSMWVTFMHWVPTGCP